MSVWVPRGVTAVTFPPLPAMAPLGMLSVAELEYVAPVCAFAAWYAFGAYGPTALPLMLTIESAPVA